MTFLDALVNNRTAREVANIVFVEDIEKYFRSSEVSEVMPVTVHSQDLCRNKARESDKDIVIRPNVD
jgi:hypothetical protein